MRYECVPGGMTPRRTAGVLQAPPRMVEAISAWVVGVVATEALRQVAERRDELAVGGVWWQQTTTGPFAIGADDASRLRGELVDELDRVEAEAKRLGGHTPSGPAPRDYTDRFPLDLSGWPHAAMVERRIAERRARDPGSLWMFDRMYDPITVVVYRTLKEGRGKNIAATWRDGFLTVWGLPSHLHREREFRSYVVQLRRTIRHELQHLAQDLLREATGVDAAGGHRTRSSPHPDGLHPRDEHALRDVEFHTRLQDAIEEYGGGADNASIRSYVSDGPMVPGVEPHDFFAALKRYDRRKWVRAVSEFLGAVGGKGSGYAHMAPSASRVASRHVRIGGPTLDPRGVPEVRGARMDRMDFFRRWGSDLIVTFEGSGGVSIPPYGAAGDAVRADLSKVDRIARSSPRFTTRAVPNPTNVRQFEYDPNDILATRSWGKPIEKFSWNPVTGEILFVHPPQQHATATGNAPFDDYVRGIILHDRRKVLFRPFWPTWMRSTPYDTFGEEEAAVSFDAQWHAKELLESHGGMGWDIEMNTSNRALAEMTGRYNW